MNSLARNAAKLSAPSRAPSARVVQRRCGCGNHAPGGGKCRTCRDAAGRSSVEGRRDLTTASLRRRSIHERNSAAAELERDADRIADAVVSAPVPRTPSVAASRLRRTVEGAEVARPSATANIDAGVASEASPLSSTIRREMESWFDWDFSAVRIHTGSSAVRAAREERAEAFTFGHDIIFGAGRFAPMTSAGRRLLAHELAHVVQQGPTPALQRQVSDDGALFNEALAHRDWDAAARALMTMSDQDARAGLAALGTETRERLRTVSQQANPARDGRLVRLIEDVEFSSRPTTPAPKTAPGTAPRPAALPLDQAFILYPIAEFDSEAVAAIPENKLVQIPLPEGPAAGSSAGASPVRPRRPSSASTPMAGGSAGVIININRQLMSSGFSGVPGGNSIILVGIPKAGTPGAMIPESLSNAWGHVAVAPKINGSIQFARGFTPASHVDAALRQSGVQAGTEALPAAISDDLALFTNTGARSIEIPVTEEVARAFASRLPMPGTPPPEGPTMYTGRPATLGRPGVTNCVGWACSAVEAELGGRVGTVGPQGEVVPVAEPAYPGQGLMGRFMKATGEGSEIARLPGATGEAVVGGMPRYLQVLKWGGRVFIVVGAAMVVVETLQAPEGQRGRTLAGSGSGFVGGLALGATAGLLCGPGMLACSIVLGLGFGLVGYFGGRAIGEGVYDAATR